MLKWNDDYAIGIETIDEQHRTLFDLGNQAYAVLEDIYAVDRHDRIIDILEDLREYTRYHFQSEEAILQARNHPDLAMQKAEHDAFVRRLDSVDLHAVNDDQDAFLRNLLDFVFRWILEHILQKDKAITA